MEMNKEKSNIVLGIIGAIIGAFLGSILWVLIGMLGFIAGLAGYLMFIFAMKGYEIAGRSIDKKGKIIALVITIIMIVFANYVYYLIDVFRYISKEYEIDIDVFVKSFPALMTEFGGWPDFVKDLLVGFALSIVSSYSTIKGIFSKNENVSDTTDTQFTEGNGQDTEYNTYYQDNSNER